MTFSVTEFRKNLFQILDKAFQGEPIEILYHGQKLRLVPEKVPSKFSRLVPKDILRVPSDQLETAIREMKEEALAEWDKEWR